MQEEKERAAAEKAAKDAADSAARLEAERQRKEREEQERCVGGWLTEVMQLTGIVRLIETSNSQLSCD